jgi:hypothetical protein
MKVEKICWLDAIKVPVDDWTHVDDLPDAWPLEAYGLVVKETENIVWLVTQYDPAEATAACCIGVLKGTITSRETLWEL